MFLGFSKLHKFMLVAVLLFSFLVLFGVPRVKADTGLAIRSVDLMKYTKDTLNNKPTDAQIAAIVSVVVNTIHPTHIAISVPLDDNSDFLQKWVDAIHSHGVSV